jgi:hypothetical protein
MFAAKIIGILLLVGALWMIVKYLIFPKLPESQKVPEHIEILEEKLERLTALKEELECAKEEKEVTEEMIDLDGEIEVLIEEIKRIENA